MTANFANVARTTQLAPVILYTKNNFKSPGIESLYQKKVSILSKLKTSLMLKYSLQNSLQSLKSSKVFQYMVI